MGETDFDNVDIIDSVSGKNQRLYPNVIKEVSFFLPGVVGAANGQAGALIAQAGTIVSLAAYAGTAPTGAALIADVQKNGVTLFTTAAHKPTIAINGHASTATLPDIVSVAAGDRLTLDIDQVGSTIAGADVFVTVGIRVPTVE